MSGLPPSVSALFAIFETQEKLRQALEVDKRLTGYTDPEKLLLIRLGEPLRMGEVAQALHCLPSSVTALVDQLEAKGLLQREPCPEDRRAKRLVLTDEGRKSRAKVIGAISDAFAKVTGFGDKEFEKLLSLLRRRPG